MRTFVFTNKGDFETNVITEILDFEKIAYKTKLLTPFSAVKFYDITIMNTTYEHFLFVKKLADRKLEPYIKASKSYILPCFEKDNKVKNTLVGKIKIKDFEKIPVVNVSVSENTPISELDEAFKKLDKDIENFFVAFEMLKKDKKESAFKNFFKKIFKG